MDKLDRDKILALAKSQEDKVFLAKVLDKRLLAAKARQTQVTDFLDPSQQQLAESALVQLDELEYQFSGGYPQAERRRLIIYPDFLTEADLDDEIDCINIAGNFRFQKVTHRDYLGSILGLGLKREKIGDLIILSEGAQILVSRDITDYLTTNLTKIHRVPVECGVMARAELILPEGKYKEIKTTVASIRLDALAAAGFATSRTQIAREITAEKLKLNWQTVNNPAHPVQEGDILSIRGRGRVEVVEIGGSTRKGRISLTLQRYL